VRTSENSITDDWITKVSLNLQRYCFRIHESPILV